MEKTIPVEMFLIDPANDDFYPDTEEVRNIIDNDKKSKDLERKREIKLTEIWLSLFEDENGELLPQ